MHRTPHLACTDLPDNAQAQLLQPGELHDG
jgi:hypothetical protein